MRRLRALVLAVVAALSLSACDFNVYDIPLPGGADTGDDPMTVEVVFSDVLDLVPQSGVKVNDVDVGKVSDIELDDYSAKVTLEIKRGLDLPADARAKIRQTSLLGEKFVELAAPEGGGQGELADGDVIPLERAGRNPEVEEVFGALSLVLNGGGIAQAKSITAEVNKALEGREGSVRSVLQQLRGLTGRLDRRKADIVSAIESLDRLARSANKQEKTINAALDELPSAIRSINGQRGDLVTMLKALDNLSGVATRVIRQSKTSTIQTLQRLDPVLTQLANAGDDFVNAFQVFLTYPFVDEVVGRDPQVARRTNFGDYTNLAIKLDLDVAQLLQNPPALDTACTALDEVTAQIENGGLPLSEAVDLPNLCDGVANQLDDCLNLGGRPNLQACGRLPQTVIDTLCEDTLAGGLLNRLPAICRNGGGNGGGGNGGGGGGGLPLPDLPGLPGGGNGGNGGLLGGGGNGGGGNGGGGSGGGNGGGGNGGGSGGGGPLGGLLGNRAAPFGLFGADASGASDGASSVKVRDLDSDLLTLLLPGVMAR